MASWFVLSEKTLMPCKEVCFQESAGFPGIFRWQIRKYFAKNLEILQEIC